MRRRVGVVGTSRSMSMSVFIIGSAEALPILCVSDFCEREREREREKERDACDVIHITLKSRVIMHMITSTARRPNASTRSEPVERSNFEVHVKTRSLALERSIEQQGRVIDERRWGSGSFAFAVQTAVDHPAEFRWQARRTDQVDVYFLFEWPWFYL